MARRSGPVPTAPGMREAVGSELRVGVIEEATVWLPSLDTFRTFAAQISA